MTVSEHFHQLLQEEAAECIQASSKVNRFGEDDTYQGRHTLTARQTLEIEVDDLLAVLQLMRERGLIGEPSPARQEAKRRKVEAMMAYAQTQGTLPP